MTGCPRGSRELSIGHVEREHMRKDVLRFALDRGVALVTDQLLARQFPKGLFNLAEVAGTHVRDRTGPEDLPHDSGIGQHRLRGRT